MNTPTVKPSCLGCAYSRPRKPVQTAWEEYEQDTRPERPKGFLGLLKWAWNPSQYRSEPPYEEKGGDIGEKITRGMDKRELEYRQIFVICTLNPKWREVGKTHYCGQYHPILINEYDWGEDVGVENI